MGDVYHEHLIKQKMTMNKIWLRVLSVLFCFVPVIFAGFLGVLVGIWFDMPMLGVVIGVAMVANIIMAAFLGTFIPLTLKRVGLDPAVGSTVFLTTATDIIGFFVFLGLATWILL